MASNKSRIGSQLAAPPHAPRVLSFLLSKGIFLGLLTGAFFPTPAFPAEDTRRLPDPQGTMPSFENSVRLASSETASTPAKRLRHADFRHEQASADARHVADWVTDSNDNQGMPFVIIDKTEAKVFVFNANAQLRGAAPALLGLAVGDDATPGIGNRKLSSIRPEERTTPAGRFVAALSHNLQGKEILWVDYDTAVSMHPVVTSNRKENRAQRLATSTVLDNRISYGCINVPMAFFKDVVKSAFTGTVGIVYVLPETRSSQQVFGSYHVD